MKGKNKTNGFNSKLTTFFERLATFSKEIESKKTNDNGSIVIEQGETFLKEIRYLINLVDEVRDQGFSSCLDLEKVKNSDLLYIYYILDLESHGTRPKTYDLQTLFSEVDKKVMFLDILTSNKALHIIMLMFQYGPMSYAQLEEYGISHGAICNTMKQLKGREIIKSNYYTDKENPKGVWIHGLPIHKPEDYQNAWFEHQNKYRKKGRIYQEPLKLRAKCRDCNLVRELEYGEPLSSVCPRCGGIVRRVK